MTGGGEAELARGRAIEQPGLQHAVLHQRERAAGDALAVERPRALAAPPQRIVDDTDAGREQALAELVAQEAGLARHRGAVDGAGEMSDEAAGDPPIEHHRHPLGRDLARIEARDRAFAGAAADRFGGIEIAGMQRGREIVVAFHRGALAGDRRHRDALPR